MPVTAVRDEGALRMWVCRLLVHIGPLGSYEFAEDFHKNGAFCRADVGIGPYDAFKDSVGIFELVLVSQERFKKTESVFFRRSKRKSCTAVANS